MFIFACNFKFMDKKIIDVRDQHRTNPKSLIPGGHVVSTVNRDGLILRYDKIKNPLAYISHISRLDDTLVKIYVDGVLSWEKQ